LGWLEQLQTVPTWDGLSTFRQPAQGLESEPPVQRGSAMPAASSLQDPARRRRARTWELSKALAAASAGKGCLARRQAAWAGRRARAHHERDEAAVARAHALQVVARPHDLHAGDVAKAHKLALQHLRARAHTFASKLACGAARRRTKLLSCAQNRSSPALAPTSRPSWPAGRPRGGSGGRSS